MCDPLGKNLLLPSWFAEDFEEEASSLEIFFFFFGCTGLTGENLLLPHWEYFGEESSDSSLGIVQM